jgi:hypothetical protein
MWCRQPEITKSKGGKRPNAEPWHSQVTERKTEVLLQSPIYIPALEYELVSFEKEKPEIGKAKNNRE